MAKIRLTENEVINLLEEIILLEAMSLDQIYATHYSEGKRKEVPKETFYKIAEADPTRQGDGMGKYTDWMIGLYRKGNLKLEDLYKATEYLKAFHKFKNRIEKKDIGQYKSLPELYKAVQGYIDNPDQATSKSDEIRRIKEGAEKVYEDNKWLVIVPHTEDAAIYYGKGTQWCTAATESENYFHYYNDQGTLYININKQTGRKYQFHFESESFMDEHDEPVKWPLGETMGLTDGLFDFYESECGERATLLRSRYNPRYITPIFDLKGYYITSSDRHKSLLKYNEDIKDYEPVYTIPDDSRCYFGVHSLKKRFIEVKLYCVIDLFDITTNELVFGDHNGMTGIRCVDFWVNNPDYVVCDKIKRDEETHKFVETKEVFSLNEMKVVLDLGGAVSAKPLHDIWGFASAPYDTNLFAVYETLDYLLVIDADTGNIVEQGKYYAGIKRYLPQEKRQGQGLGRFLKFLAFGVNENEEQLREDASVVLYDGEVVSYHDFKEHEDEILDKCIEKLRVKHNED